MPGRYPYSVSMSRRATLIAKLCWEASSVSFATAAARQARGARKIIPTSKKISIQVSTGQGFGRVRRLARYGGAVSAPSGREGISERQARGKVTNSPGHVALERWRMHISCARGIAETVRRRKSPEMGDSAPGRMQVSSTVSRHLHDALDCL